MKFNLSVVVAVASIALGTLSAPALAHDAVASAVKESIALKDGGKLHVFPDGLMAKEDKYGRATLMKSDETLETVDGRKLKAVGNEVARLSVLIVEGHY